MKAVRVLGPAGDDLAVYEVSFENQGKVVSLIRAPNGGAPRETSGRYASLKEAVARNSRSVTTAELVDVADIEAARTMVA